MVDAAHTKSPLADSLEDEFDGDDPFAALARMAKGDTAIVATAEKADPAHAAESADEPEALAPPKFAPILDDERQLLSGVPVRVHSVRPATAR